MMAVRGGIQTPHLGSSFWTDLTTPTADSDASPWTGAIHAMELGVMRPKYTKYFSNSNICIHNCIGNAILASSGIKIDDAWA